MSIDEKSGPEAPASADDVEEEDQPTFAELMATQLGGWRGLVESGIPVLLFVILNLITSLAPALIGAVGVAVFIAVWRLTRRRPVRHAIYGLFGIGLGAWLAWRSGNEGDFYLPGILLSVAYGIAMLISVVVRKPLIGWLYSVVAAGGKADWQHNPRLVRTFGWLTVLWAATYLIKAAAQYALFKAGMNTALGISRLALGYPPYALLLALTIWSVRRVEPAAGPTGS